MLGVREVLYCHILMIRGYPPFSMGIALLVAMAICSCSTQPSAVSAPSSAGLPPVQQQRLERVKIAEVNAKKELRSSEPYGLRAAQALQEWGRAGLAKDDNALALTTLQESLETYERLGGPEHPAIPQLANDLGEAYLNYGWFASAHEMLVRAFIGWQHGDVVRTTLLLGRLYTEMDYWAGAKIAFEEAKQRAERHEGPGSYDGALALAGLADCELNEQRPAVAAKQLDEALRITAKTKGAASREMGEMLARRAKAYYAAEEFEKSDSVIHQAEKVLLASMGTGSAPSAAIWETVGDLMFYGLTNDAEAERCLKVALALREHFTAKDGPYVAKVLDRMVALYWSKGQMAQAVSTLERAAEISEGTITSVVNAFGRGDESYAWQKLAGLNFQLDYAISLAQQAPNLPHARKLAMTLILRRKGLIPELMGKTARVMRSYAAHQPQADLDAWFGAKRKLSRTKFISELNGTNSFSVGLDTANEVEPLEAKIVGVPFAELGGAMRIQPGAVTVEDVAAAIPADGALIEYAKYTYFDWRNPVENRIHYAAFVLFPDRRLEMLDLGVASAIDSLVRNVREVLSQPGTQWKPPARKLEELVFQPVRKVLGKTRKVMVAADGQLSLIPFTTLLDETGKALLEDWVFVGLTSGRELFQITQGRSAARSGALVVANPDFGKVGSRPQTPGQKNRGLGVLRHAAFNPLEGTAQEGEKVAALLGARLLNGKSATLNELAKVPAPSILHIATHGYFLDSPGESFVDQRGFALTAEVVDSINHIDAMFKSGLVFAGANGPDPVEQTLLSAKEALWLDLEGTELVVLSACETGVGDVSTGQGVRGLQQAFTAAGARSLVMSLWKVDDEATRDLMVDFYQSLKKGHGPSMGLREAQLTMSKRAGHAHPFYWASFVSQGDPSPLRGGAPSPSKMAPVRAPGTVVWRGMVTDRIGNRYRVEVALSPQGGTTEYSGGFQCGGTLIPVGTRGKVTEFEEHFAHGPSQWYKKGQIQLEPAQDGTLQFRWYFWGVKLPNAKGQLTRISP